MSDTDEEKVKSTGGIAPLGYRWQEGSLIINETEAAVRRLIYELFIKHRRKKTVAKLLNDLGYRTRNGSLFSDTTIDRLLRDTTAKGQRIENGKEIKVPAIISDDVWEQANNFLGQRQTKQPVHLFVGFIFCECGGEMNVTGNAEKYACLVCKRKILSADLEEIFSPQLENVDSQLPELWRHLTHKEKRTIIGLALGKIIIGKTEIQIEFAFQANSLKAAKVWQQNDQGNKTQNIEAVADNRPILNEPLMNEAEAAKFLGVSKMTLLRKRNAGEIGFFRVGFRVLYSKEKHLIPFLTGCEK